MKRCNKAIQDYSTNYPRLKSYETIGDKMIREAPLHLECSPTHMQKKCPYKPRRMDHVTSVTLLLIEVCTIPHLPLLHHRGELPDPLSLLAEYVLRAGGADDDLRAEGRHAHLNAGVTLFCELLRKELKRRQQAPDTLAGRHGGKIGECGCPL